MNAHYTKNALSLAILGVVAALSTPVASAGLVIIDQAEQHIAFPTDSWTIPPDPITGSGDAVGTAYETTSLNFSVANGIATLDFSTAFKGTAGTYASRTADIFFGNGINSFQYAIVTLNYGDWVRNTGDPNVPYDVPLKSGSYDQTKSDGYPNIGVGLYAINGAKVYNSEDFFWNGSTHVDLWRPTGDAGAGYAVPVKLAGSERSPASPVPTLITDGLVAASFGPVGHFIAQLDVTKLPGGAAFFDNNSTVLWGTATCANDVIVGTVPLPAALPMMMPALASLVAFGTVRRRGSSGKRTAQAA